MTKGALYHHFNSNEALAVAIIDQAFGILLKTFQGVSRSSAPRAAEHDPQCPGRCGNGEHRQAGAHGCVLLRIFAKSS
jgi:AcrR family transcriptional regulator